MIKTKIKPLLGIQHQALSSDSRNFHHLHHYRNWQPAEKKIKNEKQLSPGYPSLSFPQPEK